MAGLCEGGNEPPGSLKAICKQRRTPRVVGTYATECSSMRVLPGAPSHFAYTVRDHLCATFPERWIGRGGPVSWPARSPDLTALDFFLWSYGKSLVYETPIDTEEDLRARILGACDNVRTKPGSFQRLRQNLVRRCHACIEARGRSFEHLL
ncbi:hypothetical protein ANN_06382 [Periplaneta americana]|uniref:Uncharacterized protein n=1 Tax=Periplaneta americana TaxID=6978 RepID=A0ABQ8TEZ7_PERAM|nr:hypothetical protein ANN_06382 [Periplaneta americana]